MAEPFLTMAVNVCDGNKDLHCTFRHSLCNGELVQIERIVIVD